MPRSRSSVDVPFVDLSYPDSAVRGAIAKEHESLVDAGAFVNGPAVERFESEFAAYCGTTFCIGLASGLDALRLALLGLGLEPGAEVMVPAMTFVATFEAVEQAGLVPVPIDVRPDDCGIDPAAVDAAVGPRTAALLPVHLYGQIASMSALLERARSDSIAVLEDACQAHGAVRDGVRAGSFAQAGAFSFYPAKNLGAWGDAGALVTDDGELARVVRALREHGQTRKYHSEFSGYTARLDAMQAVVLSEKLRLLDDCNERRRAAAAAYCDKLAGVGDLTLPTEVEGSHHVWHLFTVRTAEPVALGDHLSSRGISTGRHYPEPPHLSPAFAHLGYREGSFPVAEAIARETLSLPIYPGISDEQVELVASGVKSYFDRG